MYKRLNRDSSMRLESSDGGDDAERDAETSIGRRGYLKGALATGSVLGLGGIGLSSTAGAQTDSLSVTNLTSPDLSPADLAAALVAQNAGITTENVSFTGDERAGGAFSGGEGILGFSQGIILGTGEVDNVVGPNDSPQTSADFGTSGDEQLDELAEGTTADAASLEFEFDVPDGVDRVTFDYIFGSEEYNEFVGSQFNDVFAFYVNGENCAVIENPENPGETFPVSINSINNGQPDTEPTNPEQYVNNDPFDVDVDGEAVPQDELENTEMDGFTTELQCIAEVQPGETNTMRLAIADTGDTAYDSWVLLQAGSLSAPPKEPQEPEGPCADTGDASVTFVEQESDGTSVTVDAVTLENGGYVVVHAPNGDVLGNSEYLDPGTHEDVSVGLDPALESDAVLTAMAHTDDGDQSYEFGSVEGADGPYLAAEGDECVPVTDDGCITVDPC